MRNGTLKRDNRRRGSVYVESALIFMVIMGMILFIIDMGRLLFFKQYFTERARVGARYASAMGAFDSDTVKNVVLYNATTGSGNGYFGLSPSNVTVTGPTQYTTSESGAETFVTVTISNYQTFTLIPYIAGSLTMPAISASMPLQCSNNGGTCAN